MPQLKRPLGTCPTRSGLNWATATIALTEVSRQVGRRPAVKVAREARPPIYDQKLASLAEAVGQIVRLEELVNY